MIKPLSRMGTWKTYSIDHGLPALRIEHVSEDHEGSIWFATWDNGASRFDGDEFQNFTTQDGLVHDRVFFIQKDRQERLWFGTSKGVCWYDGADFHPLEDDGIAGRSVQFIYEDCQGRIWFGGTGTLGYYDGTVFHDLIPRYLQQYQQSPSPKWNNYCWGITEDPQGHLWFGFDYLTRFDGESFHRYNKDEGFPRAGNSYVVSQDHTGKVWIGRNGCHDKLWYYADGTFQSIRVDLDGNLRKIVCDREGRMWLCTKYGAFYQDGEGFSRFTPADGLPHPAVKSMFHDREHQFWFATWGGVGRYDAHSIHVFDLRANGNRNMREVSQIVQDRQGDIWIGYASPLITRKLKSVARFDGEHFTFVDDEEGSDIGNCFFIYEDLEGYLWFGGGNGLFRYEGQTLKKRKIAADSDEGGVSSITQDGEGRFIFGYWEHYTLRDRKKLFTSPLKIVYQQGEQFQTIFTEDNKKTLRSRIDTVIATNNNAIYFHLASSDGPASGTGFARWHPEEGLTWYGVEDGLIDNDVNDLLLDRHDNLWIATRGGLSYFDGSTFRTFTTEDGLPSNHIHCLFEDARGHLWIGTDRGIVHYDGRLFQTIKSPHIGPVCRILEDRDGTFWFGTVLGSIIRYRPRQTPPLIRLIRVVTDQVYENLAEVCSSTVGQPVVFEYKGLSFSTHPRDMLYVYRLQGYDLDWCPATRALRACYQDLPPGDYTFQVRAIDRDLNYSETAQAQLAVEPDLDIEILSAALNGGNEWVGPSRALRQFQTKLTEVASTDLAVLIGQSETVRQFQTKLMEVAPTDLTVLILGETGVGKGLAARALHALSAHCDGPFIYVNCGALSQAQVDSELFGHASAVSHKVGKVEQAKDGTLFLDEIGDMTLETQDKILRLLEERTFERVGGNQTRTAPTRMVAATSRDLKKMVRAGDFREDLYLRLQVFPLYIPPLREHREDIPALVEFFKNRMAAYLGRQPASLNSEVMEMLQAYHWPENVRELEHFIQRVVIACKGSQIEAADLVQYGFDIVDSVPDLKGRVLSVAQDSEIMPLLEFERRYILAVLKATNWQIKGGKGAAGLLGVPVSTLYGKMKKLGIKSS